MQIIPFVLFISAVLHISAGQIQIQCECAFAMDQVIVYPELQDPPTVSRPSCDGVAADCAAACEQAHNDWWAVNDLHDLNSATGNEYGDDFCTRYGKPVDPAGQGVPLVTVGRAPSCAGYEQWVSTGLIGPEYNCCDDSLTHQECSIPPPSLR